MLLLDLLVDIVTLPVYLDLFHVLDVLDVVLLLVTPGQVLETVGQHRVHASTFFVLNGQLQSLLPLVVDVVDIVDLVRLLDGGVCQLRCVQYRNTGSNCQALVQVRVQALVPTGPQVE